MDFVHSIMWLKNVNENIIGITWTTHAHLILWQRICGNCWLIVSVNSMVQHHCLMKTHVQPCGLCCRSVVWGGVVLMWSEISSNYLQNGRPLNYSDIWLKLIALSLSLSEWWADSKKLNHAPLWTHQQLSFLEYAFKKLTHNIASMHCWFH